MQTSTAIAEKFEDDLYTDMGRLSNDPYGFVQYAFPWGEGVLKDAVIEEWQKELLCAIRDGIMTLDEVLQFARVSGHGVGKSALVAWIVLWAMSTFEGCRGVVTANTEPQLRTKTWPELHKWYRMCITRHWFTLTATCIHHVSPLHHKTWRMDIIPWDELNTEAFAGLHNKGKRTVLLMDEASAIHNIIWEVGEGAMSDAGTQRIWLAFGNGTRNTGRFRECFTKFRHRWHPKKIDSRTVTISDKQQIEKWRLDYGEDSDFFRVRVKGDFPKQEADTLIPMDWIDAARVRVVPQKGAISLAVDVARFGDDDSTICTRIGRQIMPIAYIHGQDTMKVTGQVILEQKNSGATDVSVDEIGLGAGVVDRLAEVRTEDKLRFHLHAINVSEKAMNEERFNNKRSEMWWAARESLNPKYPSPMALPPDDRLMGDLMAPKWTVDSKGRIHVESKDATKKRLGRSPDAGDAYAMSVYNDYAGTMEQVADPQELAEEGDFIDMEGLEAGEFVHV